MTASCSPRPFRAPFVSSRRRSFGDHFLARWFLDGLGTLYVDRFDVARSVAHAGGLSGALHAGEGILIFAEGTLHRMPGLLPFQTGGFMAAVEAEAAVVPVILRGTRSLMRDGTWFPRRVPVHVRIGPPISPSPASETGRGGRIGCGGAKRVVEGGSAPRCGPGVDARPLRRTGPRQPEPPPRPHRAPHRHRPIVGRLAAAARRSGGSVGRRHHPDRVMASE